MIKQIIGIFIFFISFIVIFAGIAGAEFKHKSFSIFFVFGCFIGAILFYSGLRSEKKKRQITEEPYQPFSDGNQQPAPGFCPYCNANLRNESGVRIKLDVSRTKAGTQGFFCPECNHEFSHFDVQKLEGQVTDDQNKVNVPELPEAKKWIAKLRKDKNDFYTARELANINYEPARSIVKNLLEQDCFVGYDTTPLERFIYGEPWARPLVQKKNYRKLATVFNDKQLLCGDGGIWRGVTAAAEHALKQAGANALDAIIAEFHAHPTSLRLGQLLLNSGDPRGLEALKAESEKIDRNLRRDLAKLLYPNPKKLILEILSDPTRPENRRERIVKLLTSLGIPEGEVHYCSCGYPIQLRHKDGSIGPIYDLVDSDVDQYEMYKRHYKCHSCGIVFQTQMS